MIDATRVEEIILDCLFGEDREDKDKMIKVEGVAHSFGFDPEKLDANKEEIFSLLKEFPKEFHAASGGGMSFLNACVDKDRNQWGKHKDIESLVCLGIGLGVVKYCLPRKMWEAFPGGMPYFVVDIQ